MVDPVEVMAKAMGVTLIPGSKTITASLVISPELLAKMAAAVVPALDAAGLVVVPKERSLEAVEQEYLSRLTSAD